MVVRLRHAIAYPVALKVLALLGDDLGNRNRIVREHPVKQGGSDIKTEPFKVPLIGIGPVTLIVDAFVPVVVRESAVLARYQAGIRVLADGLIEMSMNGYSAFTHNLDQPFFQGRLSFAIYQIIDLRMKSGR